MLIQHTDYSTLYGLIIVKDIEGDQSDHTKFWLNHISDPVIDRDIHIQDRNCSLSNGPMVKRAESVAQYVQYNELYVHMTGRLH